MRGGGGYGMSNEAQTASYNTMGGGGPISSMPINGIDSSNDRGDVINLDEL